MSLEKPSSEAEAEESMVQGFETLPKIEFTAITGLKKWLAERRQRREDLNSAPSRHYDGPWATMANSPAEDSVLSPGDPDHFYYGSPSRYEPKPLGLAASSSIASAMDFALQLEQEHIADKTNG